MQSPFVEPALGRVGRGVRAGELCQEAHALQGLDLPKTSLGRQNAKNRFNFSCSLRIFLLIHDLTRHRQHGAGYSSE